jgi:hypothetical protein
VRYAGGQLSTFGVAAVRADLLPRQEAYASAVNPCGPFYSSFEFSFALQRANDLSQLAHYQASSKLALL